MVGNLNFDTVVRANLNFLYWIHRCAKMSLNTSKSSKAQGSKSLRALKASPFLCITATAIYYMWGVCKAPNTFTIQR
jgi:hypothetical protein